MELFCTRFLHLSHPKVGLTLLFGGGAESRSTSQIDFSVFQQIPHAADQLASCYSFSSLHLNLVAKFVTRATRGSSVASILETG